MMLIVQQMGPPWFIVNTSFVDLFMLFLSCVCSAFFARLFICALWSPAGKELTSWLSFVVINCQFFTFLLVSWVRCCT